MMISDLNWTNVFFLNKKKFQGINLIYRENLIYCIGKNLIYREKGKLHFTNTRIHQTV